MPDPARLFGSDPEAPGAPDAPRPLRAVLTAETTGGYPVRQRVLSREVLSVRLEGRGSTGPSLSSGVTLTLECEGKRYTVEARGEAGRRLARQLAEDAAAALARMGEG